MAPDRAPAPAGEGLVETLRLEDGRVTFVERHLARLRRGALELGLAWPPPRDPRAALAELVRAEGTADAVLRLELGPRGLVASARRRDVPPRPGVTVRLSTEVRRSDAPHAGCKTTARAVYERARAEARAHGDDEALLRNEHGHLCEGGVTNVFLVTGGELRTPALADGCVAGVAREVLLDELAADPTLAPPLRVGAVGLAELLAADEVFLTNAVQRVVGVTAVRGAAADPLALPGARGGVTTRLAGRMDRAAARESEAAVNLFSGPGDPARPARR